MKLSKHRYLFLKTLKKPTEEDMEYIRRWEEQNRPAMSDEEKQYWQQVFNRKKSGAPLPVSKKNFISVAQSLAPEELGFVVDDENRHAVSFVYNWLAGKELPPVTLNKPAHRKGILLAGNVGSGKTTLIDILRKFRPAYKRRAAQAVSMIEQAKNGTLPDVLHRRDLFIDELGTEKKSYGNELMPHFIESRYELFKSHGYITHFTTNMSPEEIAERYGPRIESRLWEMCNIIYLGAEAGSRDFRKLL